MDNTTQASSDFPPIKIQSSYDSDTENTKIPNNNTDTSVSTSSTPVTEYSDDDGGFETASERPIVDEETLAKEDDIDDGDEKSSKGRVLEAEDDNFDLNELVEEFSELNEGVEEDKKVELLSGENLVNPSEVKRVGDEVEEDSKVEVLSGENPVISDVKKIEAKGEEDKKIGDLNGENLVTLSEVKRVGDKAVEDSKVEVLSGENPVISDVEKIEVKGEEGVEDKKIGDLNGKNLLTPSEVKNVGDEVVEDSKFEVLSGENPVISDLEKIEVKGEEGVGDIKIGDLSGENLVIPSEVKRVGDVVDIKSNGDEVVEDSKTKALSGENPVTSYAEAVKAKKIVDLNGENLVTPSEAKRVSDVDEIKSKVVEDTKIEALSGENLATALEDKEVSDVGKVELKEEEAVEDKKIEALSGENSVAATDAKEINVVVDEVAIPKIVDPAESKLVEADSGGVTTEGDSVVEAMQVDLSAPEVAVVKQIDANEKSGQSSDIVEPADSKVVEEADKTGVTTEEDSVVEAIQVDLSAPEVAVVGKMDENEKNDESAALINGSGQSSGIVEQTVSKLVDEGDKIEVTTEKDSVVEDIKVDRSAPEVAVVGEVDETEKIDESAALISGFAQIRDIVEPAESKLAEADKTGVATEEDSVVEALEVDLAAPEVVEEAFVPKVVGVDAVIENKFQPLANDIVETPKPEPIETVESADSKLVDEADKTGVSTEGDSVVEAIQVDLAAPGVAVIGQTEENKEDDGSAVLINGPGQTNPIAEEAVASKVIGVDAVIENKFDPLASHNVESPKQEPMESKSSAGKDEGLVSGAVVTDNAMESVGENIKNEEKAEKAIEVEADYEAIHSRLDVDSSLKDELEEDIVIRKSVVNESAEPSSIVNRQVMLEDDDDEAKDDSDEEGEIAGMVSDGEIDGMIFGGSASAKPYIEEMERGSGGDSQSSRDHSQRIDGQIVTDSEEEGDTDDEEGDGKELFDSAALAALLKAATGAGSDNGNITITSQDGSRLFSVERPAGLGSSLQSLRPAPRPNRANLFTPSTLTTGGESDTNLSEEEKKKLEKLQSLRVKFLRIVQRLGLSLDESVAAQVLYRLALVAGRQTGQLFSLDAAKATAQQLEAEGKEDLDFSVNILVIGKSGVGKSATINSIFGEEKAVINAFEPATATVREINGMVNGVKIRVFDTPGLKSSVMEQAFNRSVFASVKKLTKKNPLDIVLYVDRLDAQTRDLNDLPLLRTVTSSMGSSTWRSAIVTLTHAASAPPDGPGGSPLSYEVFVTQRSHVVQQSIGQAVGDLRMMSPSLMNPVTLVENHSSCRKNREGQKVLPNGQSWRPQLLLLCYSMKILSEASSLSKPQDPFDHRKLFGFRGRSPPLPYMLSSMLQSRAHPKLSSEQGGEDSDVDLDDYSDSDQEEGEDEYDQLPPFKPLRKAQLAKLTNEQKKAYFEEYDYRVKLLQKKQWKEELRRMREMKKRGKDSPSDYGFAEEDPDSGAAAPVAVPLPDMVLPPSFDSDNSAYRYRFLEPTSQFLARPVLDTHGWDHDCGYDGVNVEQSLAIASRYPAVVAVQVTKDKKEFSINLDSSVSAKHGDNGSSMAGFDIQPIGKQLAYIVRGETKFKNLKKNKTAAGVSVTFLGENVATGLKVEDQIGLGKQYVLVGSAGTVRSQSDAAYGANIEVQRRELDFPIGQVQSTFGLSIIKWRGDLALGFNSLAQFSIGRNSKVAVRAGINNKLSGQINVRTSSSEHLSLALAGIIPTALAIYRKIWPDVGEKYSIY